MSAQAYEPEMSNASIAKKQRLGTANQQQTPLPKIEHPVACSSHLLCERLSDVSHPSAVSGLKRLLDIVGSVIGLLATLMLAVPLAIAIWIDNPGPILYSQVRCGCNGASFRIWKFRSMVCNAERLKHLVPNNAKGLIFKNENDPRITRVGRFIRKTSLDEFPQFWNVLKGEMSLVGTRPPTVDEVLRYEPHHWQRLRVKPGLTGEWQVSGRSSIKDFEQIVNLDLVYQQRWSLRYDLQLIMRTVVALLFRRKDAC